MRHFLPLATMLALACGGTSTNIDGGGGDAAADAPGNGDGSSDGASDATGDAPACPLEKGSYAVTFTGQGCGTISMSSPICVQQTGCDITFSSGAGGSVEMSGTATIDASGSFSGASIQEGTMSRTGCTGSWDMGSTTITVDCGGVMTTQSCRATLVLSSAKCN